VAPSRAIHAVREPALDSRGYVWPALEGPASAAVRSYVSDVEALAVAHAYDQAYDARDVERMVAMVHEDVEAVTPRGTMRGHAPLRAFMARQSYGVSWHATERRYFYRGGNTVVVFVQGEWRYVNSGDLAEREDGAAVYTVHDGLITRFQPFEDLDTALAAAAMTQDDEATS